MYDCNKYNEKKQQPGWLTNALITFCRCEILHHASSPPKHSVFSHVKLKWASTDPCYYKSAMLLNLHFVPSGLIKKGKKHEETFTPGNNS